MTLTTPDSAEITLRKSQLDLSSTKAQMILGLILIAISCVVCYWKGLSAGFLLDDFYHVDYVARAFQGQWHDFLREFYSNWTNYALTSYRPAISLSYFLDYCLWHMNAVGYHVSNILMFYGCCLFVSLITLEITGKYGNRLGAMPAVWAGLLFSAYPLHPEAVAWIVGRVDVQSTLFYLASVFAYMRFRLFREQSYLWASVLCFMIALPSKEMAVTLPIVIALAEIILPLGSSERNLAWKERLRFIGVFWLVLAVYAVFRTLLLGTVVGGYGESSLSSVLKSWRVFLDKASFSKLFFPLNEEITLSFSQQKILGLSYALIAGSLLFRLVSRSIYFRPFLFLLLWIIVAILPTFQIWHIYPNLVGSRLFYLSSAPFCIALALAALPAVDVLNKFKAKIATGIGAAALLILFISWSLVLRANIEIWKEAGLQMDRLKLQLLTILTNTPDGKKTLFLNLPQDYSGAGMLGRSQFLEMLSRPPFSANDFSNRLLTLEPQLDDDRDHMRTGEFVRMLNSPNLNAVYIWQLKPGQFVRWNNQLTKSTQNEYSFLFNGKNAAKLVCEPASAVVTQSNKWYRAKLGVPQVVSFPDHIHVIPGSTGTTIYVPDVNIDPLKTGVVKLSFYGSQLQLSKIQLAGKIQLVWENRLFNVPELHETTFSDTMTMPLNQYQSWSLYGPVTKLGVRFLPGAYILDLSGLEISSSENTLPTRQ